MTVLKELDLKDNWLTSLAEGFVDLRQLEYVRLSGNPFSARAWILRNVVEPLENEYKYKVFFYSRDSFVGFTISENVRHCVKNSRRLVVVLGKNWDKDDLLVSATREALARCRKDMVHFMTVLLHQIVVEDIDNKDIQQYTRRRRYIHTDDKYFLKKLVYEMPHLKSSVSVSGDKENTKVADAGLPEHVALHDIVAAAEKEQKKVTEKDDAMVDRRVFFRQISGDSGIMDLKDNTDTRFGQPERQSVYPRLEGDGKDAVLAQNLVYHRQRSFERYSKASAKGIISAKSVFVWYSDVDLAFTLKAIVEPLEKLGHVCILQDRDFPLGAAIQENIVHAAETCTRCVLILSDKTARDEWFTFTFHVTFDRQLQSRDHRVALVKRDDVDVSKFVEEIQQTIKSSALLTEDDPWFWKRLLKFVDFDGYDIC
nr:hypothetical protein BaRGS_022943 [Batillaria attramentaria]